MERVASFGLCVLGVGLGASQKKRRTIKRSQAIDWYTSKTCPYDASIYEVIYPRRRDRCCVSNFATRRGLPKFTSVLYISIEERAHCATPCASSLPNARKRLAGPRPVSTRALCRRISQPPKVGSAPTFADHYCCTGSTGARAAASTGGGGCGVTQICRTRCSELVRG